MEAGGGVAGGSLLLVARWVADDEAGWTHGHWATLAGWGCGQVALGGQVPRHTPEGWRDGPHNEPLDCPSRISPHVNFVKFESSFFSFLFFLCVFCLYQSVHSPFQIRIKSELILC